LQLVGRTTNFVILATTTSLILATSTSQLLQLIKLRDLLYSGIRINIHSDCCWYCSTMNNWKMTSSTWKFWWYKRLTALIHYSHVTIDYVLLLWANSICSTSCSQHFTLHVLHNSRHHKPVTYYINTALTFLYM